MWRIVRLAMSISCSYMPFRHCSRRFAAVGLLECEVARHLLEPEQILLSLGVLFGAGHHAAELRNHVVGHACHSFPRGRSASRWLPGPLDPRLRCRSRSPGPGEACRSPGRRTPSGRGGRAPCRSQPWLVSIFRWTPQPWAVQSMVPFAGSLTAFPSGLIYFPKIQSEGRN